jgi:isoaspartyl peptidase/L-asparaginase-like protein (Ntn-hydrolase superfamily)
MFAVSIWPRGLQVNAVAADALKSGESCLDAIEAALRFNEDDTTDHSTGVGGLPNAAGEVELDAAVMFGPTAEMGGVGALRNTRCAISVARRVMEKTPHALLVGAGAEAFAREEGFAKFDLLTDESRRRWEEWRGDNASPSSEGCDTMGTIAIDRQGRIAVGNTTSGTPFKLPGRVGDSPIPGAGLYCVQGVGGALATGVGEEAMRICATFLVVELMARGDEPEAACRAALDRLLDTHPSSREKQLGLAALRADGRSGGWSVRDGFAHAYFDGEENRLIEAQSLVS